MSSAKWSAKGSLTTVKKGIQLMTLDQTASNADANKLATLEQVVFGAVTTSPSTTGTLDAQPQLLVYTGASAGSRTLPAGSSDIIGIPIRIWNETNFVLTVSPAGADTFTQFASPSTTSLDCYGGQLYELIWTGSIWIIGA